MTSGPALPEASGVCPRFCATCQARTTMVARSGVSGPFCVGGGGKEAVVSGAALSGRCPRFCATCKAKLQVGLRRRGAEKEGLANSRTRCSCASGTLGSGTSAMASGTSLVGTRRRWSRSCVTYKAKRLVVACVGCSCFLMLGGGRSLEEVGGATLRGRDRQRILRLVSI